MVPPVAVQITAVFAAFVTVAPNCCVPFGKTIALAGEMLTPTDCAAVIVIAAEALLVGSSTLVAFAVKEPVVAPAVKRPAEVMVPPVAVQVTAALVAPVTVAANWRVVPAGTEADVGEMAIVITGPVETVTVVVAVAEPPALIAVSV